MKAKKQNAKEAQLSAKTDKFTKERLKELALATMKSESEIIAGLVESYIAKQADRSIAVTVDTWSFKGENEDPDTDSDWESGPHWGSDDLEENELTRATGFIDLAVDWLIDEGFTEPTVGGSEATNCEAYTSDEGQDLYSGERTMKTAHLQGFLQAELVRINARIRHYNRTGNRRFVETTEGTATVVPIR